MGFVLQRIIDFFKPFLIKLFQSFLKKFFLAVFIILEPLWNAIKQWFSRLPIYLAWAAAFYLAYSVFVGLLIAALSGFMPVIPSVVSESAGIFLPSNTFECLTLVYSSKLYRFAYDHKQTALKVKLQTQI